MKTLQLSKKLLIVLVLGTFITSCSKEDINENSDFTSISVNLTSESAVYKQVYLDVKEVQIQIEADETNPNAWVSLGSDSAGVYDFSDLKEDEELVIVQDLVIPVAHIYRVKLVLGNDNSIVMNNVVYAIDTASNESVNIVDRALKANMSYEFTIAFELDKSLAIQGPDVTLNPKMNTEMRLYELF